MAKDWIGFFGLKGDPFNTIPLQSETDFGLLFVKTDDIGRYIDPLLTHFEESKPFLRVIVGPRGSGKSTILHYAISLARQKKGVVACYVSHQPSIIEGQRDPVYGIGNDTTVKILKELTKTLLTPECEGGNKEVVDFAKGIGFGDDGLLHEEQSSFPQWSPTFVQEKVRRLFDYLKRKNIRALIAIDNYDKHDEEIAIRYLASHNAQTLFEDMQSAGVSLFLTADVEWSKKAAKNEDLNYLGEPVFLCPINPIEAISLIHKRIAAKLLAPIVEEIFDNDAISSVAIKEEGISRNVMETCRIGMIEAAGHDQKHIARALMTFSVYCRMFLTMSILA